MLFLLTAMGCSHKNTAPEKTVAETFKKAMEFRPSGDSFIKAGENDSPSWSTDGKKFLFVSRNRSAHKNSQIYEFDTVSGQEHRITFSDGDSADPHYLPDGDHIIYSSTTDELKERPALLRKKNDQADPLPPSDLYISRLNGLDIVRLTNHQGYDGLIRLSSSRNSEFYFTSLVNKSRTILKFNLIHKTVTSVFSDNKENRLEFATINELSAWLSSGPDAKSAPQLMVAQGPLKTAQPVSFGQGEIRDLSCIAGEKKGQEKIIFSAQIPDKSNLQIFLFDPTKNCIAKLIKTEKAQLTQPELSPDQKKLIYVSDELGSKQIMIKTIDWSQVSCDLIKSPTAAAP